MSLRRWARRITISVGKQEAQNGISSRSNCMDGSEVATHPGPCSNGFMPNCFRCGRPLLDTKTRLRRRVRTGEWIRRGYGKSGSVSAVQQHYGMRIVCAGCAAWIDMLEQRHARKQWIQILVGLAVLAALFVGAQAQP
jgi:hypothetical protein